MTRSATHKPARTGASALANRLRIIGGRWRGVRIEFPPLPALRPSPDRVRETLFNWLAPVIADARCLDLFAGSGALGIEALSRGAAHAVFVDNERAIGRHLTATLQRLGAASHTVQVTDAIAFLAAPPTPFDIVFLDPPFASGVLEDVLRRLAAGWVSANGYVYVERPADEPLPALPAGWTVHRSKRAGRVGYHLLHATTPVAMETSP